MKLDCMNAMPALKESATAEAGKSFSNKDDVYDEKDIREGKSGEESMAQNLSASVK